MPDDGGPGNRLAQIELDVSGMAIDGLRPAALGVSLLFLAFAFFDWLEFPPDVRLQIVLYDVLLVVFGFGLFQVCRRRALTPRAVHMAATGLSFGVLGSILATTLVADNPLFSFHISGLLIASASIVLSAAWAIAIVVVEVTGWALVGAMVLSHADFVQHASVIAPSVVVAFVVHIGRRLARNRILELRRGDARREIALQQALAAADEARRGLDRKVEERTAALRTELEERGRLEAQLRHAQKLEAVGRLAGGIAHDFNNLLTVIRMSLLTVGELAVPDDVRAAIRDANDSTDRAAGLTHDLLAFARKQTLERTSVAAAEIVRSVERMVRRVAEASIRIEVRLGPDIGDVIADGHQIEQVLLNLAINACDAMNNRGTLSIGVDAVELTGSEAGRAQVHPGTYVRFAVTDTGTGMDEATRRSLFEPFFTTKDVGRGTGLGLAVAHGIVTQHGGQISVETELGKGSTFMVLLPRARGTSTSAVIAIAKPLPLPGHETLLVVEDEPAVRRAVQRNLERLGYHVIAANDGEDALRLAESLDGIDLLLSDVVMPGIDGPELACRLRAKWSGLPVLFVTGYSADRLARSDALGPHDRVLEKPYQFDELARTIRAMMTARASRAAPAT
jgi:signal transduction histidine kinase/ActR/RegA family two-component response regulator